MFQLLALHRLFVIRRRLEAVMCSGRTPLQYECLMFECRKFTLTVLIKRQNQKFALNGNAVCMCLSNNPCGIGRQKSQLTKGLLINHPAVERKSVNAQTGS